MASVLTGIKALAAKSPVVRGMLSYSIIWPTSVIIQEAVISRKSLNEMDWGKCARFSLYGALFVAPTLYTWVRVASQMWPRTSVKTAVFKALVEQVSYTPFAMTSFFFGMSLLERKTVREAATEVQQKFLPTYKVAMCVWPFVAIVNFSLIPERNRVPFISLCSLIWTCFLAYVKLDHHETQPRTVQLLA